ncbi:MAG: hypothetical protein ACYTFG_20535 [Planctomycetota bacterium]
MDLLTAAGVPATGMAHWRMAENSCLFLVAARRWWWRHLFVIDKDTLKLVRRRRFFAVGGR